MVPIWNRYLGPTYFLSFSFSSFRPSPELRKHRQISWRPTVRLRKKGSRRGQAAEITTHKSCPVHCHSMNLSFFLLTSHPCHAGSSFFIFGGFDSLRSVPTTRSRTYVDAIASCCVESLNNNRNDEGAEGDPYGSGNEFSPPAHTQMCWHATITATHMYVGVLRTLTTQFFKYHHILQ